MFRAKTVFVLGAGASVEVGFPAGDGLLKQIVDLSNVGFEFNRQTKGDRLFVDALRVLMDEGGAVDKLNEHIRACWQLAKSAGQALSIDNVIEALEDPMVDLVGKIGIARAILNAESKSPQFRRPDEHQDALSLDRFSDTWLNSFTQLLTEGIKKSSIDSIFDNIQLINFNYDRCIEQYLPYSLSQYYGIGLDESRNLIGSLKIHRPYGSVGKLPWQAGEAPSVPFGGGSAEQLAVVSQQIRTFSESVNDGEELSAIRDAISSADRIIFLGFAFHRQNVELIAESVAVHSEILATCLGISNSDQGVIHSELSSAFNMEYTTTERIHQEDCTCSNLFRNYWRTISAAPADHSGIEMPEPFIRPF